MPDIHSTAIVDPNAELGDGVSVGPYSVIEAGVTVGDNTEIAEHVILRTGTTLGEECRVFAGAVIGEEPQDLSFDPENRTYCRIGDRTLVREHATIHRGTKDESETTVGNDCFIMAGAHVAHNCVIGDRVIMANAVLLAGHVKIEEGCFLGGGGVFQQFTRVGKLSICSGNIALNLNIPPYMMAIGYRPWIRGLNVIGLRRAGLSRDRISALKTCFKLLYKSDLTLPEALERIEEEVDTEESRHLVEFCREPSRYAICPRSEMESATLM